MSRNVTHIERSPEVVFSVLSKPECYAEWVVGSSETRGTEGRWPEPGSLFHHTQVLPKVGLKDTTSVLESDPPHRLRLCVRIRPFLVGEVELLLEPEAGGTKVTMKEHPVGGLLKPIHNPVLDALFHLRNIESLRRLERLAQREPAVI